MTLLSPAVKSCVFRIRMSMFREKHPSPQKKTSNQNRPTGLPTVQDRRRSGLHFCIGSLDSTSSSWHCGTSSLDDRRYDVRGKMHPMITHDGFGVFKAVDKNGAKPSPMWVILSTLDMWMFDGKNIWLYTYFHEGFLFPWPIVASWQLCVRFGVLFDRYTSVKSKNLGYEKLIHQNCAIDWTAMVSMNSTKKVPKFLEIGYSPPSGSDPLKNKKHGNSLAWAIGAFFAQVLSVNEFFEFSIDVGYVFSNNFGHFADEIDGDKSWSLQSFFSKMKRSLVIQKAHWFFRCGFLELFMWVTSFDWFCSRNIENISWSMNSMDESLWFLEMLPQVVCMERSLKCSWQIDVGVQSADPFFR